MHGKNSAGIFIFRVGAGFVAGLLSEMFRSPDFILSLLFPGAFFAIAILYSHFDFHLKTLRFLILSIGGYIAAYLVFFLFTIIGTLSTYTFLLIATILSGSLGGYIMLIGYSRYIHKLPVNQIMLLTLLSGMLSLSLIFPPWQKTQYGNFFQSASSMDTHLLFYVWQTGMATALALIPQKKTKK